MNRRTYLQQLSLTLGFAVSAASLSEIMISCKNAPKAHWKPVVFSEEQAFLVEEICETILPRTKTPGARDIGVTQFIDASLKTMFTDADRKKFLEDLDDFNSACSSKYEVDFQSLDAKKRIEYLTTLDRESAPFPISMWGIMLDPDPKPITFFRKLKSLCLSAFFTSEKIGKNVLNYLPIPGQYEGCTDLKTGQKCWTE
ncbi:MAG: gluconate 2-dehydrogenase subunit 3 family protein [Spirosomaceae bacterium]|jgi:hypothetical protein|nr:gluconate 2-dehydrogenase subunit 3 family protein [Spirosomataceae bacterium]